MNYEILKTELQDPAYTGLSDADAATALNAENISVKTSVLAHDIRKYLMLVDKLLPMEASSLDGAKAAVRSLEIFPAFDLAESAVETKLIAVLDALITDGLIDSTDRTNILALGNKAISRATELGLPKVSSWNITEARAM